MVNKVIQNIKNIGKTIKKTRNVQILLGAIFLMLLFIIALSYKRIIVFFETLDFDIYLAFIGFLLFILIVFNATQVYLKIAKSKGNLKFFLFSNIISLICILALFFAVYVFRYPNMQSSYPGYDQYMVNYDRPVEIVFNVPVRTSNLKPSVTPEFKGHWEWEPYLGIKQITRKGRFYPEITPFPEERFVVYVTGIGKATDTKENHEYGFVFKAPQLPNLQNHSPAEDAINIQRGDSIILEMDNDGQKLVDWDFDIKPNENLKTEFLNNQVIFRPEDSLKQGQKYKFTASYKPKMMNLITGETILLGKSKKVVEYFFTTVKEPLVDTFKPTGGSVKAETTINVKFEEKLDKTSLEQNFTIEPKIEGIFEWVSENEFIFKPSTVLPKETEFKVTFKNGIKSLAGGILEKDLVYKFTTIGKVKVKSVSPTNNSNYNSEYSSIGVRFDQPVNKKSAQNKFNLFPNISGSFSWKDNTMIFKPSQALSFNTTYQINIEKGVKTIYGLDSDKKFTYKFSVRPAVVQFSVPVFYQPPGFSCNIFTARMILAWKGKNSSNHVSLISEIGYNQNQSGGKWTGNPYKEYIGNADGSWGYGVYYPPIQKILSTRGISSVPRVGWNVTELARAIQKGHPVIIWRYNGVGGGQDISWSASDGTYIQAFNGMHSTVISGYTGPAENPASFYVNDPWLGQFWMNRSTLDYYWSFSNRVGLEIL